jgi:glucose dehydrogenase
MKSNKRKVRGKRVVAALVLAGYAGLAQSGPVTDSMLSGDAGESWLHTNGNYGGHRYSSLTSLNSGNAKDLKVAWTFSPGGKTDAQATPSYHDGMVFFPQDNKVFALDWQHRPRGLEVRAQAAGRLGRLQRSVLHRASIAAWRCTG